MRVGGVRVGVLRELRGELRVLLLLLLLLLLLRVLLLRVLLLLLRGEDRGLRGAEL